MRFQSTSWQLACRSFWLARPGGGGSWYFRKSSWAKVGVTWRFPKTGGVPILMGWSDDPLKNDKPSSYWDTPGNLHGFTSLSEPMSSKSSPIAIIIPMCGVLLFGNGFGFHASHGMNPQIQWISMPSYVILCPVSEGPMKFRPSEKAILCNVQVISIIKTRRCTYRHTRVIYTASIDLLPCYMGSISNGRFWTDLCSYFEKCIARHLADPC